MVFRSIEMPLSAGGWIKFSRDRSGVRIQKKGSDGKYQLLCKIDLEQFWVAMDCLANQIRDERKKRNKKK